MVRDALSSILPPRDTGRPATLGRFPLVDALRAVAALMIFGYHASLLVVPPESLRRLLESLSIGVPVFFLISGFVLYRPFAVRHLTGQALPGVRAFAWRRLLRIVPAFWVALTVAVSFGDREALSDLPVLYLFAQVYDPRLLQAGLAQAWSLDNEIVFYAMLPLIAAAGVAMSGGDRRSRLRWAVSGIVFLFVISELYKVWFHSFGSLASPGDFAFSFHPGWNLDLFAVGMAFALWSAWREVEGGDDRLERFVAARVMWPWVASSGALRRCLVRLLELLRRVGQHALPRLASSVRGVLGAPGAERGSRHGSRSPLPEQPLAAGARRALLRHLPLAADRLDPNLQLAVRRALRPAGRHPRRRHRPRRHRRDRRRQLGPGRTPGAVAPPSRPRAVPSGFHHRGTGRPAGEQS